MADSKLTALTALTGADLAATDVLEVTDISDTTMDASGTSKKISTAELVAGINGTAVDLPDTVLATTVPGIVCNNASAVGASGILKLSLIKLRAGQVVTSIAIPAANTGGASLTHSVAGLYTASQTAPVLLVSSADDTTATWTANTYRTFTMSSPYTVTATGYYYVGCVVTGTTLPNFYVQNHGQGTAINARAPIKTATSSTGLTTTLPNPAAALTVQSSRFYAEIL